MAGDPDASKAYVEEWKKRNLPWIGIVEGMRGFDAVNVVAKAIEAAKEPTAPKIMAALKKLEMRGLYGLNKFDQNGQSYCNIIVTQVKDGKYSVVAMTPSSKLWEMSAAK
jgi:branched-chain amino acid transport system substrate-binding protein